VYVHDFFSLKVNVLAVADQHLVAAVKAFRNCSPGGPESHKILAADPDVLEENHEELYLELLQLQRRMTISFLPVSRAQHFVRTSAVEMNMNMSQEAFCAEIHRENARRFQYHLD